MRSHRIAARRSLAPAVSACVLALALAATAPPVASAQDASAQEAPADASRDEEARALFQAGVTAYSAGRYGDALARFEAAYAMSPRPDLLYNLGNAADRMRDDEVALDYFVRYLEARPDSERRAEVEARIAALRASIAERAALSSQVDAVVVAPPEPVEQDRGENVAEAWWLWTIVGVVVVGAGVGIGVGVAMSGGTEPLTEGDVGGVVFALGSW